MKKNFFHEGLELIPYIDIEYSRSFWNDLEVGIPKYILKVGCLPWKVHTSVLDITF